MTINKNDLKKGDIIRVFHIFLGYPYYHYGVMVDKNDVVHFNIDFNSTDESQLIDIKIIRTDLDSFSGIGFHKVKKDYATEFNAKYPPEEIAVRALSAVGSNFGGYNLFTNNCEHFANWCATGKRSSAQVPVNDEGRNIGEKIFDSVVVGPTFSTLDAIEKNTLNFLDKINEGLDKLSE